MNKIILAVVGLPGAGKTEVVDYLIKKTKWPKVYFGQGVLEEVSRRGLEISEKNEKKVREDLRAQYGMAAMAIINMPKIKKLFQTSNVIIESHYSWEEYLELRKEFGGAFQVLAIYSSPETRIKRLAERPIRPLTSAEVISRDYSQIENLHQAGPIARADFTIINEGTREELYSKLDSFLQTLKK